MIRSKSIRVNTFLIMLCLLSAMIPASDAGAETVVFSVGNFEPHHYEKNGEVKGVFVETIGSVCERLGLTPKFIVYPWKRSH